MIEGTVTDVAFGGEGILRNNNQVIFVPFSAPKDRLKIKLLTKKKNFARGEIIQIDSRSPLRTNPVCPYFTRCGGCQLQHIFYEHQLKLKQQWVYDALTRIGKIPLESLPEICEAPRDYAYRQKIVLKLWVNENRCLFGYIGQDKESKIAIEQCPIFSKDQRIFLELKQLLDNFLPEQNEDLGTITVLKNGDTQYLLYFQLSKKAPPSFITHLEENFEKQTYWSGISVSTPGLEIDYGNTEIQWQYQDLILSFSARNFIQNYPEQSFKIYERVIKFIKEICAKQVLDLYCGIGITSLLIAKQGSTCVGIENNSEAIHWAEYNAITNQLEDTFFINEDVEKSIHSMLKNNSFDCIIMNPPRIGMQKEILQKIGKSRISSLIYISCMPATLARDLAILQDYGYKIQTCIAYDMFPQTTHVETLVILTRPLL